MSPRAVDAVWQGYYGPFLGIAGLVGRNDPNNMSVNRQAVIERMYMRILTELATNRYKWVGLPESIDPRFLEMTLMQNALSVFYWDDEYGMFFALQGTPSGEMNMYNNPLHFTVLGNRFINKRLSAMPTLRKVRGRDDAGRFTYSIESFPEECVPIWANYLRQPDWDIIMIYASKLAEIDRTIEINSKHTRRTKVLAIDSNMLLSGENILRQIDEGQAVVKVNAATFDQTIGNLTALDLGVDPKSIEALQISRTRVWNECMGLLGINNANQDKKERLVSDEVDANNDQIDSMRWVNLNARQQAAHMISIRWPELKGIGVNFRNASAQAPEVPDPMVGSDQDTPETDDE